MKCNAKLAVRALCLVLLLPFVMPTAADEGKDESRGKERKEWEKRDKDERKGERERRGRDDRDRKDDRGHYSYFHDRGYTNLRIPEGHLPPPGECRIWYPGKPPGQQPPPVKCDRASGHVPQGAWLMRRPKDDRRHVNVHVYDERSPGVVISIGVFMAETGAFVRYVSP